MKAELIAFIGVGNMGNPMAENLIKAGKKVRVYDVSNKMIEKAKEKKFEIANNINDLFSNSPTTVITMLPEGKHSKEVYLGNDGIINKVSKDCLLIDCSTIDIKTSIEIGIKAKEKGIKIVDAPVSGGVNGAEAGVLSIMVGGDKSVLDSVSPILNELGSKITYCGSNGMGQVTKLSNQIIGMGNLAAMCEAIVFASKAGADPEALINAWSAGAAGSWMVDNLGEKVFKREFEPGFMVKLAQKDLNLVLDAASQMDVALFTTPIISQIFRATQQSGFSDEGIHAYVKILENIAGLNVKSK